MAGKIVYNSDINVEINAVKSAGGKLLSGTDKINSLGTTNLDGAKNFLEEENKIYKFLKQLSDTSILDSNDALEIYVDFDKTDKEIGNKIKKSWGKRIPESEAE